MQIVQLSSCSQLAELCRLTVYQLLIVRDHAYYSRNGLSCEDNINATKGFMVKST